MYKADKPCCINLGTKQSELGERSVQNVRADMQKCFQMRPHVFKCG